MGHRTSRACQPWCCTSVVAAHRARHTQARSPLGTRIQHSRRSPSRSAVARSAGKRTWALQMAQARRLPHGMAASSSTPTPRGVWPWAARGERLGALRCSPECRTGGPRPNNLTTATGVQHGATPSSHSSCSDSVNTLLVQHQWRAARRHKHPAQKAFNRSLIRDYNGSTTHTTPTRNGQGTAQVHDAHKQTDAQTLKAASLNPTHAPTKSATFISRHRRAPPLAQFRRLRPPGRLSAPPPQSQTDTSTGPGQSKARAAAVARRA